jgi:hypothetical protein
MAQEIDLSGESDPEDRVALYDKQQSNATDRSERSLTDEYDGSVSTPDFCLNDALDALSPVTGNNMETDQSSDRT